MHTETPHAHASNGATLLLSCALVFLTQLGVTLYLPSLPDIAGALRLAPNQASLSLLAYFLGSAAPILFWGAATDRYGRKTVLLLSLALFGLASVAAAGATGGPAFIGARLLQGVGAGGASTVGRILVRDNANGALLARNLSYLSFSFVSALGGGQFLGGLMQQYAPWQAQFLLLAAISAILAVAVLLMPMRGAAPAAPQSHVAAYLAVLRHPGFRRPMVAGALGYGALIYLQEIGPYLFQQQLGLSARQYGNAGLLLGLAYFCGSLLVNRLALRLGYARLMRAGLLLMLAAGALLLAGATLGEGRLDGGALLALVLCVYCAVSLGQAVLFPNSMAAALDAVKGQGSHSTALFGFALQLIATGVGSLAVVIPHGRLGPVALLLLALTATALLLSPRRRP
ncbi:MFS transporter [Janthinobacterium fluminis]|uniref:MFS transporter n=1 Tax=Janthinobacterium fluminis TaxID=2987524 RepID=A0ABT5K0X1_9BURK|nr:MFS transporter [Janthinobacterium fluminis]MDC8758346.1 MFS transporter [Janthinobacterium fluminis]